MQWPPSIYEIYGTILVLVLIFYAILWFGRPKGQVIRTLACMGLFTAILAYPLYTVWEEPILFVEPVPKSLQPPVPIYHESCTFTIEAQP